MKKYFVLWSLAAFLMMSAGVFCQAQQPAKPEQLKAEVVGHKVELSWQNPNLGEVLVTTGFESEGSEQSDRVPLDVDGWTVKTTNNSDYSCTWFNYPNSDFTGADNYDWLIHSGQRSAVVYLDVMEDGEHDMHQDEWLISPVLNKAAYLQFSSFIDPRVVLNGSDPDYPDHFVVVVSTDGGQTWGEPLWDARYDATPEGGWQTVTLALTAAPTETMHVAFRAYGDFIIDEETGDTVNTGLFATWAIDDVTITAARPGAVTELVSADFETAGETENGLDVTFESTGWTVRNTHGIIENDEEDPFWFVYTWFRTPTTEDEDLNAMFMPLNISGNKSAIVGQGAEYQDEFLISPAIKPMEGKSLSMKFNYKTTAVFYDDEKDAMVMQEMVGHYVVVVSKDGGKTWEDAIWDMAKDEFKGSIDEETSLYEGTVTLVIDAESTDDIRIAFRAYGDKEVDAESGEMLELPLGAFWIIDDVVIDAVDASLVVAGYKIQLDGKDLAEGIQGMSYTDKSEKTAGKHIYSVYAVSVENIVSEPATVEVTLDSIVFTAPRNFVCTPELDAETGKYTVTMKWDAPETDFQPVYYNTYSDNALSGTELTMEDVENGIGISGCWGVYEFSVEAVYQYPNGVSERVKQRLALGVRFGVTDLKAESEGQDVVLSWTAPQEDEKYPMGTYTVYRSGEKIAEGLKETTCRDVAVEAGYYQYTVVAVYADGVEARTGINHQVGEEVRVALPYVQSFNTTFLPANWRIKNESDRTPDKYTWYFDDQSRLGIKGEGFDGGYAAIDCYDIGMYRLNTALEMPVIDLTKVNNKADVTLSFNYSYAIGGIFKAGVEWSFDGEDWYLLGTMDKENGYEPTDDGDFHIQFAAMRIGDVILERDLERIDKLYMRFRYEAARSHYWAIDNVRIGEGLAVEKTLEDFSVSVSSAFGRMQVRAAQAIRNVEVYAMNGVKLAERAGDGLTEMTLPVPQRGPAIVRVTTAQGVKTVKILL